MAKRAAGKASPPVTPEPSGPGLVISTVRVSGNGVHLDGRMQSTLNAVAGWKLSELPRGVLVEKGGKARLIPWPHVALVEYADA